MNPQALIDSQQLGRQQIITTAQDIANQQREHAARIDHASWLKHPYTNTLNTELNKEFERILMLFLNNSEKWSDVEIRSAAHQLRTIHKVIGYTTERKPLN